LVLISLIPATISASGTAVPNVFRVQFTSSRTPKTFDAKKSRDIPDIREYRTDGWYKYVGLNGRVVGINRFGESAPDKVLFKEFGFTVENVVKTVEEILK